MAIQFNGTNVLFTGEQVSFCADHCDCPDPDGPDVPPDDPRRHCDDCKSSEPCGHCTKCTPVRLSVLLAGITLKTSCLACTDSSVIITSSDLSDPIFLTQSSTENCVWRGYVEDASVIVATRYTAAEDCTGASETTSKLWIELTRTATKVNVLAFVEFADSSTYVLFAGETPSTSCDDEFTITGQTADDFECGVRLGKGGTATVKVCPDVLPPCTNDGSGVDYDCLTISELTFPSDCDSCDATADPAFTGILTRVSGGLWESDGAVTIDTCGDITVSLQWRDGTDTSTAPLGCGFYVDLTNSDPVVVARYFHNGSTPNGHYTLAESLCDQTDFSFEVTVAVCPVDDTIPDDCDGAEEPSVMILTDRGNLTPETCTTPDAELWDGLIYEVNDCVWDIVPPSVDYWRLENNTPIDHCQVSLTNDPDGVPAWRMSIYSACIPFPLLWDGYKYVGKSPTGTYTRRDEGITPLTMTLA